MYVVYIAWKSSNDFEAEDSNAKQFFEKNIVIILTIYFTIILLNSC